MDATLAHLRAATRWGRLGIALVLVGVLASCGAEGPLAPYEWQGVGQTSARTYTVRLVYTVYSGGVLGSYYIDGRTTPTGKAEGTINGDIIQLALTPTTTCTFTFVGEISETRLTGTFVPDPCPTGVAGTWDLLRSN